MKAIIIINIYIDGRTTDRKSKPGGSRIKWLGKEIGGRLAESREWESSTKGAVRVSIEDKSHADLILLRFGKLKPSGPNQIESNK